MRRDHLPRFLRLNAMARCQSRAAAGPALAVTCGKGRSTSITGIETDASVTARNVILQATSKQQLVTILPGVGLGSTGLAGAVGMSSLTIHTRAFVEGEKSEADGTFDGAVVSSLGNVVVGADVVGSVVVDLLPTLKSAGHYDPNTKSLSASRRISTGQNSMGRGCLVLEFGSGRHERMLPSH
jgi:hypothetical protein